MALGCIRRAQLCFEEITAENPDKEMGNLLCAAIWEMDFVNTEPAGRKLLFSLLLLESSYVYKLSFFPTGSDEDCICLFFCHGQKDETVLSQPPKPPLQAIQVNEYVIPGLVMNVTGFTWSQFYGSKEIQLIGQFIRMQPRLWVHLFPARFVPQASGQTTNQQLWRRFH